MIFFPSKTIKKIPTVNCFSLLIISQTPTVLYATKEHFTPKGYSTDRALLYYGSNVQTIQQSVHINQLEQ